MRCLNLTRKSLLPFVIVAILLISSFSAGIYLRDVYYSQQAQANSKILDNTGYVALADTTAEANYIIGKNGTIIYALNTQTGAISYSGTDAYTVIQNTINVLMNGGFIFLTSGTYGLTDTLLFGGGSYDTKAWILEGEGISTVLQQTTSGKSAIKINNATRVHLANFKISCSASASHGIYCANDGADECSFRRGSIENVQVNIGNPNAYCLYLVNLMDGYFNHLRLSNNPASTGTGAALCIENNSTTTNYGNSEWGIITLYTRYLDGVQIRSVNTITSIHHVHMDYLQGGQAASSGTHYAMKIGQNVGMSQFDCVDLECWDEGLYLNGVSGANVDTVAFLGGYVLCKNQKAIHCGLYTSGCVFKNLYLDAPSPIIHDEEDYRQSNVYEDLHWEGSRTITVAASPTGGHYPIFRGKAGNGKFFTNYGTATITAGQTSSGNIAHGCVLTPRIVIIIPTSDTGGKRYWVSSKDGTNFVITIDSSYGSDITFDWEALD